MIKREKLPPYRIDKFLEMLISVGIDLDVCWIRTYVGKATYVRLNEKLVAWYSEPDGICLWNTETPRVKGTRSAKLVIGDYEPLCLRKEDEL